MVLLARRAWRWAPSRTAGISVPAVIPGRGTCGSAPAASAARPSSGHIGRGKRALEGGLDGRHPVGAGRAGDDALRRGGRWKRERPRRHRAAGGSGRASWLQAFGALHSAVADRDALAGLPSLGSPHHAQASPRCALAADLELGAVGDGVERGLAVGAAAGGEREGEGGESGRMIFIGLSWGVTRARRGRAWSAARRRVASDVPLRDGLESRGQPAVEASEGRPVGRGDGLDEVGSSSWTISSPPRRTSRSGSSRSST